MLLRSPRAAAAVLLAAAALRLPALCLAGAAVEGLGFRLELKGSIGEGPNQTNYSDRSSVRILAKFNNFL